MNPDNEIGPSTVTLSAAKGLSRWAERCFARVYTERSECAQHDSAVTHTASWMNVLNFIIGLRWPDEKVNKHYRVPPGAVVRENLLGVMVLHLILH